MKINKISSLALTLTTLLPIAAHTQANELGVGFYDFGGTGVYLQGKLDVQPNLKLTGEFGDTDFTMFRLGVRYNTASYLNQARIHLVGGVSHYDGETGAWVGAGTSWQLNNEVSGFSELIHDTAGPGFFRLNLGLDYAIDKQLSLHGGYSVNSNSVSNELRLGARYQF